MTRAILLVDHGSRRTEANSQIELVAERLRARLPDAIVESAHMELAPPSIAEGIAACVAAGATHIRLHPYFLASGFHTRESIPELVEEALRGHPGIEVHITKPLGVHDKLIDVVLERLEEPD
jgi:sirohydrochlorin ferrochelatase